MPHPTSWHLNSNFPSDADESRDEAWWETHYSSTLFRHLWPGGLSPEGTWRAWACTTSHFITTYHEAARESLCPDVRL